MITIEADKIFRGKTIPLTKICFSVITIYTSGSIVFSFSIPIFFIEFKIPFGVSQTAIKDMEN